MSPRGRRLLLILNLWLNRRTTRRQSDIGPPPRPEDQWSRYGVTGELCDALNAPAVDESLVVRFMAGQADVQETAFVRDRLRQFSDWRQFVVNMEQAEIDLFTHEPPHLWESLQEFQVDFRRELAQSLEGNRFAGLALGSMIRGYDFKDNPGGPAVDTQLLVRALQGPPAGSLEEVVLAGKYVLMYQSWHKRFRELCSE